MLTILIKANCGDVAVRKYKVNLFEQTRIFACLFIIITEKMLSFTVKKKLIESEI